MNQIEKALSDYLGEMCGMRLKPHALTGLAKAAIAAMPVQAEPQWQGIESASDAEITRLAEALRAAEERENALREALVQHNDRLRSAAEVAARDGRETNWLSFRGQVRYTLAEYHELVKEVRAELERIADE